jgi:SAM-dependent methyltransferase
MNKIPFFDGAEIFSYYKTLALQKVIYKKNPIVLKTYLYNESEKQSNNNNILKAIYPYIYKGYAVEIDQEIYDLAVKVMYDYEKLTLIRGSVTDIAIGSDIIDLLLDFSTIDHVEHYQTALREYKRVLRPDGEAVVIVWLTEQESFLLRGDQYCFNIDEFTKNIEVHFKVLRQSLLLKNPEKGGRMLVEYDLGIS